MKFIMTMAFSLFLVFGAKAQADIDATGILKELLPDLSQKMAIFEGTDLWFDSLYIDGYEVVYFQERNLDACMPSACLNIFVVVGEGESGNKALFIYSAPIQEHWEFFFSQCFDRIVGNLPACRE